VPEPAKKKNLPPSATLPNEEKRQNKKKKVLKKNYEHQGTTVKLAKVR
jgi:hypothetical protein